MNHECLFTNLMSRDYYLWSLAIETARNSDYAKYRVGAVVAKKRQIISKEPNKNKTHTQAHEYHNHGIHAEFDALRYADEKRQQGDTIVIARLDRMGNPVNSIPCYRCMNRIRNSHNIKWIIFFKDGEIMKVSPFEIEGHISAPIIPNAMKVAV
jgi:tRNA(Arg) A34 adenosine deaminase TadA